MTSLILQTATRFLVPVMLVFSVFLLLRGHDQPGGGFAGGLVAAAAFTLHMMAYDVKSAARMLRVDPHYLLGSGLLLVAASGTWGLARGHSFLTGSWWARLHLGPGAELSVGTPLIFDVGVYLVASGATLLIVRSILEE